MPGLDSYVKFLLQSNTTDQSTTFTDTSGQGHTITQPGTVIKHVTAGAYWGSTVIDFTAATDGYLEVSSDADFNMGTGDFTMEITCKWDSTSGSMVLLEDPGQWRLYRNGLGISFQDIINAKSVNGNVVVDTTYPSVAKVVRRGTTLYLFTHGTLAGTLTNYTQALPYSGNPLRIGANNSGADRADGKIQRVVISKGISRDIASHNPVPALYDSNPPPTSEGGLDDLCAFLLESNTVHSSIAPIDKSKYARTITRDGTYSYHDAGGAGLGPTGYRLYTSSALQLPVDEELQLRNRDFTIEGRIKCSNAAGRWLYDCGYTAYTVGWYLYTNASRQVVFGSTDAGMTDLVTTTAVANSTWTHIAVVRSGNTIKIYINGTEAASTTFSGSIVTDAAYIAIGKRGDNSSYFDGHIQGFRISTRVARWTADFTVPTAFYDGGRTQYCLATGGGVAGGTARVELNEKGGGADAYNVLLIHSETTDGSTTFRDSSPSNHTLTPTSVTHSTTRAKFGASSIAAQVNQNRLRIATAAPAIDFGTGDFTIDLWLWGEYQFEQIIIDQYYWTLRVDTSGYPKFADTAGSGISLTSNTKLAVNAWTHLAVVRYGSRISIYQNGVLVARITNANTLTRYTGYGLSIFALNGGGTRYYGYGEEIRISKGIARWLRDSFTPPKYVYGAVEGKGGAVAGGTGFRNPVTYEGVGGAVAGGSAKVFWMFAEIEGQIKFYGDVGALVTNVADISGKFPNFYGDINTGAYIEGKFPDFYGDIDSQHAPAGEIDGCFPPFYGDISARVDDLAAIDGKFPSFYGDVSAVEREFADVDGCFPPFYGDIGSHNRFFSIDGGFPPFYGDVVCFAEPNEDQILSFTAGPRGSHVSPVAVGADDVLSFVRGRR
jgi:hypothetical protein